MNAHVAQFQRSMDMSIKEIHDKIIPKMDKLENQIQGHMQYMLRQPFNPVLYPFHTEIAAVSHAGDVILEKTLALIKLRKRLANQRQHIANCANQIRAHAPKEAAA